ncbi:uncharacterized protein LY89DRAFT_663853 [Mollisia scopiformis]|uniref:Uncharacterized protein n=1 Tax=Mollisia scopiformis TaxID=149040 RepID=A0A194XSY3_MOLSC|nr:uncharacterized protein LY89DRAFT_663853 [Mollisia scopiformis]KUJ23415.1 hypothetical protein LY89DRAFT_663853 [Mollisia scopiformis]
MQLSFQAAVEINHWQRHRFTNSGSNQLLLLITSYHSLLVLWLQVVEAKNRTSVPTIRFRGSLRRSEIHAHLATNLPDDGEDAVRPITEYLENTNRVIIYQTTRHHLSESGPTKPASFTVSTYTISIRLILATNQLQHPDRGGKPRTRNTLPGSDPNRGRARTPSPSPPPPPPPIVRGRTGRDKERENRNQRRHRALEKLRVTDEYKAADDKKKKELEELEKSCADLDHALAKGNRTRERNAAAAAAAAGEENDDEEDDGEDDEE